MKCVVLAFLLVFFSSLNLFANDDSTLVVPTPTNETSFDCQNVLDHLKESVLESIQSSTRFFETFTHCFADPSSPAAQSRVCTENQDFFDSIFNRINQYHQDYIRFRGNQAQRWIGTLEPSQQDTARNCFEADATPSNPTGIFMESGGVDLRVTDVADNHPQCRRLNRQWREFFSPYVIAFRNNSNFPEGGSDLRELQTFRQSIIGRILEEDHLREPEIDREWLRSHLLTKFDATLRNMQRFERRVSRFNSNSQYQLYSFSQHFDQYLQSRPDSEHSSIRNCREESSWSQSCGSAYENRSTLSSLAPMGALVPLMNGECGNRNRQLIAENLPLVSFVDGVIGRQNNRAAYEANLITEGEFDARAMAHEGQLLFSLPITGAGAASTLARTAGRVMRPRSGAAIRYYRGHLTNFNQPSQLSDISLSPGNSYTVIRNRSTGELILGERIRGYSPMGGPGTISGSGSHIRLGEFAGLTQRQYMPGAIRINPNGTIDISGYGGATSSINRAREIRDSFVTAFGVDPSLVRVTPGRLSEFPAPR